MQVNYLLNQDTVEFWHFLIIKLKNTLGVGVANLQTTALRSDILDKIIVLTCLSI
jgi:hypothetical protein